MRAKGQTGMGADFFVIWLVGDSGQPAALEVSDQPNHLPFVIHVIGEGFMVDQLEQNLIPGCQP